MSRILIGYLDPGTGSVILQALIGGVAGLAVTAKLWWHRVTGIFRRDSRAESPAEPEGPPSGSSGS